jgi:hypothetical protein
LRLLVSIFLMVRKLFAGGGIRGIMLTTKATEKEMLDVLIHWADSKGWWQLGGSIDNPEPSEKVPFWVSPAGPSAIRIRSCSERQTRFNGLDSIITIMGWGPDGKVGIDIPLQAALIWAWVEESIGKCQSCQGRGRIDEWKSEVTWGSEWADLHRKEFYVNMEFRVASKSHFCKDCKGTGRLTLDIGHCEDCGGTGGEPCEHDRGGWMPEAMACSDCLNTGFCPPCFECGSLGRIYKEIGELILDSQPHQIESPGEYPDLRSMEALMVLADRLQLSGNSLGLHLAHLLAGKEEGTYELMETVLRMTKSLRCPTCENSEHGLCCLCGIEIPQLDQSILADPYASEINGDDTPHLQCERCSYNSAMEI